VNGSITKSSLPSGAYIVSYWSKNGQQTISGTVSVTQGRSLNGWILYEHKVNQLITGVLTISGTGSIDDLKLFPEKALMTSYTHKPLVGVKTQCDPANHVIYYEYDQSGRLLIVRDQDKSVIRKYCYNYSGQQNNCEGSITTTPIINSITQTASLTISVDYTAIDSCYGATITYLDLTTSQSAGSTGGCNSPRLRIVPFAGRIYRIKVTCYSALYPNGISSEPMDIYIPY
jgi:YD repeat-containing protein